MSDKSLTERLANSSSQLQVRMHKCRYFVVLFKQIYILLMKNYRLTDRRFRATFSPVEQALGALLLLTKPVSTRCLAGGALFLPGCRASATPSPGGRGRGGGTARGSAPAGSAPARCRTSVGTAGCAPWASEKNRVNRRFSAPSAPSPDKPLVLDIFKKPRAFEENNMQL